MCVESQIMALYAYVDDSGSDPSHPLYVLGGLIMPDEQWKLFSADWDYVLHSSPNIDYFKASEVWDRSKGPFKNLTTKERSAKVDALADVIFTYKPLAVSTRVEWAIFKKFSERYQLDEDFCDPYFFLFFSLIGRTAVLALEDPRFEKVNFTFDEQGRMGIHARAWYLVFLSYCTGEVRSVLGNWPQSDDEKKNLPLQGADMFAWYHRRNTLGSLGYETHQRIWKLFEYLNLSIVLEDSHLEKIADDLRFPKAP